MLLRDSVRWGLHAEVILENYIPYAPQRRADLARLADVSWGEGSVRLVVSLLLERIELDLKRLISSFLLSSRGPGWWTTLPASVRRNAENRHRWTEAQLGPKRIGPFPDVAWLSMGDLGRVLDSLDRDAWRMCLHAETARRSQFSRTLSQIKTFRDYSVAHPKPKYPSNRQLSSLCAAVRRLPLILNPCEWEFGKDLLNEVQRLPEQERLDLIWEGMDLSRRSGVFERWLANQQRRSLPFRPTWTVSRRRQWLRDFLAYCAVLDPGGRTFFGRS